MEGNNEKRWFEKIRKGDEQAFEALFRAYYKYLCAYAFQFLANRKEAEEIAQEVFVILWEKRAILQIHNSVKNYLFRSVRNHCLNQIQHRKVKHKYIHTLRERSKYNLNLSEFLPEPWLAEEIEKAVNAMPEKRKEIFRLSREKGLTYRQIAEKLHVSVKTVEAQMGLALKNLREKLKVYIR